MINKTSGRNIKSLYSLVSAPLIILTAAVLNVLFWWFNIDILHSPIFMDSIFTAVVAALFGPLAGIMTGLLTNMGMELLRGFPGLHWPFSLCNMATGLIVGIMARRKNTFILSLNVIFTILMVVIINSILGALIAIFVFSGVTFINLDSIISVMTEFGQSLFAANFWSRVLTNIIDKTIAVYAAFLIKELAEYQKPEIA